jgi:tetratricopeptide (TPR) repeat protein
MDFGALFEQERYREITESAKASDPNELDSWDLWYLARSYGYLGSIDVGRRLFHERAGFHPDETWPLMEIGKFESEFEAWGEALRTFEQILTREPDHAEALYRSGHVLTALKRRSEAAERMAQAEPFLPAELRDQVRLEIAAARWRPEEAAEELERLEARAKVSAEDAQMLANFYRLLRMPSESERALNLHPLEAMDTDAVVTLVWVRWKQRRWREVVELGERLRKKRWLPRNTRYCLCSALARLKRGDEALRVAQEVPEDLPFQLLVKMFVLTETDPEVAFRVAEELLILDPENVDAWTLATAGRFLRFDLRGAREAWLATRKIRAQQGIRPRLQFWGRKA